MDSGFDSLHFHGCAHAYRRSQIPPQWNSTQDLGRAKASGGGSCKCVPPCHFPSPENLQYCGAEGVMCREQRCPVLPGSEGRCLLYLVVKCSPMALSEASWTCPWLRAHLLWWGWLGRQHGWVAGWYSQSAFTSFLRQYPIDHPQRVSQIWHAGCNFVWAAEDASLPPSKEDELCVLCPPWVQLQKERNY